MPEIVVLDTHIWFWLITQEFHKFPVSWRDVIETASEVGVSPISCYEIAHAEQRGRLELPCPVSEWLIEALTPSGIILLPLTSKIT